MTFKSDTEGAEPGFRPTEYQLNVTGGHSTQLGSSQRCQPATQPEYPATLTFVVGIPAALAVPVPAAKTVPVMVAPPAPEGDDGESPLQPTLTKMTTNDVAIRLRVMRLRRSKPQTVVQCLRSREVCR